MARGDPVRVRSAAVGFECLVAGLILGDLGAPRGFGMLNGLVIVRFVYTFEETLPRRDGSGVMARQFSGAATFEFRREGDGWAVVAHFFDDIGRSGQIELKQVVPGSLFPKSAPRAGASSGSAPSSVTGTRSRCGTSRDRPAGG